MGKGDPKKPRGKMSSYAFFVQTCREEHKKKHPDASVNFSEFSKKCSERWKTMSAKEKGKFEDMAKADKARYEREMKTYIPPKGETKKKFKDPNAPKRPPSAFFLFCSEYRPKIKGEHPGLSIGDVAKKLGEMWNNTAVDDKQPYEKKAAKLKEKYEKDIAAYRAKGKPDAVKMGVVKAEKSKKKKEEEDDEKDEEDEEEEETEEEPASTDNEKTAVVVDIEDENDEAYTKEYILKEAYPFFADNNQDAIWDLAHLKRYVKLSKGLEGTGEYYYQGDVDSEGKPHGTGLDGDAPLPL